MKDVYIPTHEIITRMARGAGFKSVKIRLFRERRDPYRKQLAEYLLELSH